MDDESAEGDASADVDRLMAGIDELLARSLAIMAQRQAIGGPEPQPLREGWQPSKLVEA